MARIPLMRRIFPVVVARRKRPLFAVAAAYWKPTEQLHNRVLLDLTGGRAHAYAGSTKCAFIGGRGGPGVSLQLPGTSGNYASTPDHASLDITGDIEIRARVEADSWNTGTSQPLVFRDGGGDASYGLSINSSGGLTLHLSADGTTLASASSSVPLPAFASGQAVWFIVQWDATTKIVRFYYTLDSSGANWTGLGSQQTLNVASIFAGSSPLRIGNAAGFFAGNFAGRIYRAQVYQGYYPSNVAVCSASFAVQAEGTLSFAEATGKTVTVLQAAIDTVTAPKYLPYAGTKSWYCSGGAGSKASCPDSVQLSVTGDIDLRVKAALDNWASGGSQTLIAKTAAGVGNGGWRLSVNGAGNVVYNWSPDGTTTSTATSTVTTGLAAGATKWIRATHDLDNGAVAGTVTFYTSGDGAAWTQLGAAVTVTLATGTFDNAQPVTLGSADDDANRATGRFYNAQIYASLNGTSKRFDVDFTNMSAPYKTVTETANSATVTINYPLAARPGAYIDRNMWTLGGGDYFEIPDRPKLNFALTEDFSVVAALRHPNQSATTTQSILTKKADNAAGVGWGLFKSATADELAVQIADGTNVVTARSLVASQDGQNLTSALVRRVALGRLEAYQDKLLGAVQPDNTTATLANTLPVRIGTLSGGGTAGAFQFLGGGVWREAIGGDDLDEADREFGTDL